MAKKFKDYYDLECAELIADKICKVKPDFRKNEFLQFLADNIENKELFARLDEYVVAFNQCLGSDYIQNLNIFEGILGPELKDTKNVINTYWWLWTVSRYIEKYGLLAPNQSLDFIYRFTKRFTAEFAIRPILEKFPEETLQIMLEWSVDENVHVRRLASEGARINLPWAKKSTACLDYFDIYKQILSNLKNDPEKYVQKSVGNNLNDLMKLHPDKANQIIISWEKDDPTEITKWIIKHGQRSINKPKPKKSV